MYVNYCTRRYAAISFNEIKVVTPPPLFSFYLPHFELLYQKGS